jgi:AraC family transcriptional regulator of adaptative response/methylated-DNA-[protein]-cysteine methyltransferase
MGMAPSTYQKGGTGETIQYSTVRCELGWLLVAATSRGLCAVSLGSSIERAEANLRREYHSAKLEQSAAALESWTRAIVGLVAGRAPSTDLPFDVQATAFQWQVWRALTKIPAGQTRTYGELAEAIGRPGAARAVARACASNPLAIAIPCHRALPASGGVGGYRWGARRKQALLAREGKMPGRD